MLSGFALVRICLEGLLVKVVRLIIGYCTDCELC